MADQTYDYDVLVIGSGPGGYVAAIRAAQLGLKTACAESRETLGGTCLNVGCIPSKALLHGSELFEEAAHGVLAKWGVVTGETKLDLARLQEEKAAAVGDLTKGVEFLFKKNKVDWLKGLAIFKDAHTVDVGGKSVTAKNVVIATGSSVTPLPGVEVDNAKGIVVDSTGALALDKVPGHLVVIGGGVIGLELGSAYQRLGSRLTVVELTGSLLPGVDADLTRVVHKRLEQNGATILTGTRALGWHAAEHGVQVELNGGRETRRIAGSLVLVAAGFVPNGDGVGLDAVGVRRDAQGHVLTDERCATNVPGIFAIGDVAGPPYLAHKAYKEAEVLAEVLTGHDVVRDWRALPAVIFSDPEIATVGVSEAQARALHSDVVIGKMPFAALGRAQALGESEGFVKLIAHGERLVGAGIVGPEASELVAELTLAIEVGASLEDLALTIHTHPTLAEAVHEAAEHGLGRAVHIMNKKRPAPEARRNVA
jgi:dihydrolipoamide dehydrogenase